MDGPVTVMPMIGNTIRTARTAGSKNDCVDAALRRVLLVDNDGSFRTEEVGL